ncbi:MAG TPA: HAD family hydrolase [Actinophytocola sp.]|uniref:HAD family hydrolase n=1 Tax=Actinophytocola sp. TaxID=1872138 RepID=UPI002DBDE86B|nr:HAD family hydrolase [Actinophytocola sp.]HEU5471800.1 HAD family hydrolase [Actinophytocola sp.]
MIELASEPFDPANGVLFDFSGTLFHLTPRPQWFDGLDLDAALVVEVLTSPTTFEHLPDDLADDWERRDLDPAIHHRVYLAALRAALPGVPDPLLETIYARLPAAASWEPYPDTLAALRELRAGGVPVGVVSNIPFDIRDVFRRNEMAELVDAFVLSYEEGVMKPDPAIFLAACDRIGTEPERTLMIGDSEAADGGARGAGLGFAMVERIPPADRPHALISALAEHGLAGET